MDKKIQDIKLIQDLFYNKRNVLSGFKCEICGKQFGKLTGTHLKTHNITRKEYIEKYAKDSYLERDLVISELVKKISDLYVSYRYKHVEMNHRGVYSTISVNVDKIKEEKTKSIEEKAEFKKKSMAERKEILQKKGIGLRPIRESDNILHDYKLYKHLKGEVAISVFPRRLESKWAIFDVDSKTNLAAAQEVCSNIFFELSKVIPKENIYRSYSGDKGYHIDIFFEDFIDIKILQSFYYIVMNKACINTDKNASVTVEFRPEEKGYKGHAIKIPLCINFKTDNHCCFVDDNYIPIEDEIKYLLNIGKINPKLIIDYVNSNLGEGKIIRERDMKGQDCEDNDKNIGTQEDKGEYRRSNHVLDSISDASLELILREGLTSSGTRHNTTLLLAMYLKNKNYNQEDTQEILFSWTIDQINKGMAENRLDEDIRRELKSMIEGNVFNPQKNYHLYKNSNEVYISKQELDSFAHINKIKNLSGKEQLNCKKTLFAMIIHCKRYGNKEREFYMTYDQMSALSSVKNRTTLIKCIDILEKNNYIKVLSRNMKEKSNVKCIPNVYKVNIDIKNTGNKHFYICDKIKLCNECIFAAFNRLYSKNELKSIFSRNVIQKYKVFNINCIKDKGN